MFGPRIQQSARRIAESIVRPLAALGLTPNMATIIGLLLNSIAATILAFGYLRIGGLALLIAGLFDMVDGALARVRNQKTTFGAFFDSTIDRYSEGITLLGLIVYALRQPSSVAHTWVIALAYVAALGSVMVSYTRARAEGLGLSLRSGLMARPERVVLLSAGLILGGDRLLVWTLLLLAITSVFTSVQRIVDVYRILAKHEGAPSQASARAAAQAAPLAETQPGAMPESADGTNATTSTADNTTVSDIASDTGDRRRAALGPPTARPSKRPLNG